MRRSVRRSTAGWWNIGARAAGAALGVASVLIFGACGKSGPPLPPLVKVPVAPAGLTAERRGRDVALQFSAPTANTDGTKPANVERVEVYGFTGPSAITDDELLKLGSKVASVTVRAPKDPDTATEPDEPAEEPELEEEGVDQGATVHVDEELTDASYQRVVIPGRRKEAPRQSAAEGPLLGPPNVLPSRLYVAVGFNKRGRKGPLSKRVTVPLVSPPAPPGAPTIEYDEHVVRVAWGASPSAPVPESGGESSLPSRAIGMSIQAIAYNVYDVSPRIEKTSGAQDAGAAEMRLTMAPVSVRQYDDTRIEWGVTRCYVVRAVETAAGLSLESDALPPVCKTLVDTFPPRPPKELKVIATSGAMSLIWEPNDEPDLAGYFIVRGVWPGERLERITPEPIREATFNDTVMAGNRYVYAVQAVDRAGNVSEMSGRVDETAR